MCHKCGCDSCHSCNGRKKLVRCILYGVGVFVITVLFVIFLFWVITKPSKPRFTLRDSTFYTFNLSSASTTNVLTTSLQVTISSRNPNDKIGVYYEKLDIYASYRNQQITIATLLPETYQGHKENIVWSPFLNGNSVPVEPVVAVALMQELNAGMVLVNIKVAGKVKWKVGTWISGNYQLNANCPAYITFGDACCRTATGSAIKNQFPQGCAVEV